MHGLLLIWIKSMHYNTNNRLVPLLQLIADHVIAQSCNYITGEPIRTRTHTILQQDIEVC